MGARMKFSMKGLSSLLLFSSFALSGSTFAASYTSTGSVDKTPSTSVSKQAPIHHRYKGERVYKDAMPVKHNHFEVIGALGIAKLNQGNSTIGVTSSETDGLVQTNSNSWNTFAAQLGAGYIYYFRNTPIKTGQVQWFQSIEPQLNIYQLSSNSIRGNVWRFNDPDFIQLNYDIPIHSTRLMLDAALDVATWKKLSIYAKGGIGEARTRVGYSDAYNASSGCTDQNLSLSSRTNSTFAWEAGAGFRFDFNQRIGVSLEYLYADLGKVKTSATGSSGTITSPMIVPAQFTLRTQTALLGLHVAI